MLDSKLPSEPFFEQHRRLRVFLLLLLFIFALLLGLGTYAAAKLRRPYLDDAPKKVVTVKKGSTSRQIAKLLEEEKIISGDRIFLYYLLVKRASADIQAGSYELSGGMTIPEIVEVLTEGSVVSNEVRIRVGEGWNINNIVAAIDDAGLGEKEDFFKLAGTTPANGSKAASGDVVSKYDFLSGLPAGATLEGYLFPDTYFVSREGGVEEFVHKMLRNFDNRLTPEMRAAINSQGRTLHQVMTVASLVEGEVGRNISGALTEEQKAEIENERRTVADIFWTRVKIGMALESDATISYATGKPRRQATLDDLEIQSPYNTYRRPGFPPGPINNPSLAAIEAALNPADTPYLFFLSAPDGKAYFAKTLEEHKQNRARYLK